MTANAEVDPCRTNELEVLVLYLRRPLHDRYSIEVHFEGRFRYSDLKEAAPGGSLWVLYVVEWSG